MICPSCGHDEMWRNGHTPSGLERYKCPKCKRRATANTAIRPVGAPGTSTLIDEAGNTRLQWVKTQHEKHSREREILEEMAAELRRKLPKIKAKPAPKSAARDLCNLYVVTDYHFGMLAWPEETNDAPWNLKEAEKTLLGWFGAAIAGAPSAEVGIFCQLGDYLHWDGLEAVTPTNKHVLDADTRFPELVRTVIRCTRQIIGMLLKKYPRVHVLMAEGNHDPASSVWLRECLAQMHENEPRVTVDTSPQVYYAYKWGDTSLFFHHGHKRAPRAVADAMAVHFREMIGQTKHSYCHLGHKHEAQRITHPFMIVDQHETLAPRDAHAARGGWAGSRSARVETYHKRYGRVATQTIKPEMLAA